MTSPNGFVLVVFSLLAMFGTISMAREAVFRLKAGPIRFRFPLASMANPPRRVTRSTVLLVFCVLLNLTGVALRMYPPVSATTILFLWVVVNNLQSSHPRRDARRWLVVASGLLGLLLGTMVLADGLRVVPAGADPLFSGWPRGLMLVFSVICFVTGAATIQECLSGTLVRERGLEIFGATHTWPRIVVKDWQECDGGFALRVSILSARLFGMPYRPDVERIVPVPAPERPALADFLAGHAATAGCGEPGKANVTHALHLLHTDRKGRDDPTEGGRCR